MASRAILRRRKIFSDYLNVSARSIQSFPIVGHGSSSQYSDSYNFSSVANQCMPGSDCLSDRNEVQVVKEELLRFTTSGSPWRNCNGIVASGYGNRKLEFISPMGIRLMSPSVRYASTATANQPNMGSDDEEDEELVAKKRKEASPEECDQAVVGLNTAKAKAREKRLHESQRIARSILRRVWATLLGIGPALRAVASMSRLGSRLPMCSVYLVGNRICLTLLPF